MPETDPAVRWATRLNDLARRMAETESSLHPSAWPGALRNEIEEYKRFAKAGPQNGGADHD